MKVSIRFRRNGDTYGCENRHLVFRFKAISRRDRGILKRLAEIAPNGIGAGSCVFFGNTEIRAERNTLIIAKK